MPNSNARTAVSGEAQGPARILHLTAIDDSLRYLLAHQLTWLKARGFEVHSAARRGKYAEYVEEDLGVHFHSVHMNRRINPISDALTLWDLLRLFRRERFDIVHTHTLKPMLLGALAAKIVGVPIVVNTVRPYVQDHHRAPKRVLLVLIDKIMAAMTDHLLAQNPNDVERYVRLGICAPSKISALGNGIDLGWYDPAQFSRQDIARFRSSIGLPEDSIVVGMVGRYARAKGYEEFFAALSRLAERDSRIRFLTVGSAAPLERDGLSNDLPRQHGLDGRGVHLEHRDDLPIVYASMDVLLFPSHRDAFPRVLMEAAAMGKPVVATATNGAQYCVRHGETGLLVSVGDVDAMVDGIERLSGSQELRLEMGAAARRQALALFNETSVFLKVEQCYRRLLGGIAARSL